MVIKKSKQAVRSFLFIFGVLLLSSCAGGKPTLYQWERYQTHLYEYFVGEGIGPEDQIHRLEEDLQKIEAHGKIPPPGYHAHLGLLYSQAGKNDQFVAQLLSEKKNYPESSAYIDFLLKNRTNVK
ncbi:MAG: DUF4810 domain-containing protein [Nitrospirota bacterium]